jgi:predicted metal-dependent phosphoesterase TrpH
MMTQRFDLHTHTICSDGTLTPAELVARAHARGVDVLALTDHDVTDGVTEAREAAAALGVGLVSGVEVSVTWDKQTIHVVGLNIDTANAALQSGLARLREFRDWRAEEIGRRLAKHRVADALAGARRLAKGAVVSRTHFARFLLREGYVRTPAQAFKQFLCRGRPGHVPGNWAPLAQAVAWIRGAGGQAVLAHPARYKLSAGKLRKLLGEFRECGGEAIEVVSGNHDAEAVRHFADVARTSGFLASMGSDYHGPENDAAHAKPWADLGRLPPLPDGCVPVWERWEPRVDEGRDTKVERSIDPRRAGPCPAPLGPRT